jgi:hypothetical protein
MSRTTIVHGTLENGIHCSIRSFIAPYLHIITHYNKTYEVCTSYPTPYRGPDGPVTCFQRSSNLSDVLLIHHVETCHLDYRG